MANIISPNMNLIVPGVGSEAGPTYALDVNASLTLIDQHDHSPGKGVQVTPAGININATLSMNNNIISQIQAAMFQAQSSASTNIQSLSVAPGGEIPPQQDLWYTPDTGIPIQLTKNGVVNATIASLIGWAYSSGTWFATQDADALPTNPAAIDSGQITLRPNIAATSFGVTIVPPSAATYNFNMPATLPASRKFLTIDNSGNVGDTIDVDNSTIVISSNTIQVPAGGITITQIANGTFVAGNMQFLPNMQSVSFSTAGSYTWTVPNGINYALIQMVGGGAGGGAGICDGGAAGGGGGGSGAIPTIYPLPVVTGITYNIVVGAGGTGGAQFLGGTPGTVASPGLTGSPSIFSKTGAFAVSIIAGGATNVGTGGVSSAAGLAPGGAAAWGPLTSQTSGGTGTGGDPVRAGSGGASPYSNSTALGGFGTGVSGGGGGCGGGGGGGAGLAAGGFGGNGATFGTPSNGSSGNNGFMGGGGGGGGAGAGTTSAHHSGAGGNGGDGTVIIYYGSLVNT